MKMNDTYLPTCPDYLRHNLPPRESVALYAGFVSVPWRRIQFHDLQTCIGVYWREYVLLVRKKTDFVNTCHTNSTYYQATFYFSGESVFPTRDNVSDTSYAVHECCISYQSSSSHMILPVSPFFMNILFLFANVS